jgi:hypothetical protein
LSSRVSTVNRNPVTNEVTFGYRIADSLEVERKRYLLEVIPLKSCRNYSNEIDYSRVKTENLDLKMFERIMYRENSKDFTVEESEHFFEYEYKGKPRVYISKEDGRIYSLRYGKEESLQALILLSILNKFSLVEGYKRIQRHRSQRSWNIGF